MALDPDPTTDTATPAMPEGDFEPVRGRIVVGVDDSATGRRGAALGPGTRASCGRRPWRWCTPGRRRCPRCPSAPRCARVDEGEIDAVARASVDEMVDDGAGRDGRRPPEVMRTILPGGGGPTLVEVAEGPTCWWSAPTAARASAG